MSLPDYSDFDERYFNSEEFENAPRSAYHSYDSNSGSGSIDYETFVEDLETLTGSDPTILIVGCGTGVTVKACRDQSSQIDDAYGMDISQWAIDNHASGISQDIIQGDARVADDFDAAQDEWNVNQAFDTIYTEFLLSHYDDAQAREIYENCVEYVSHGGQQRGTVVHRVWSGGGHEWENDWFNLKTISEWQSLMDDIELDGVSVEWIDYDQPEDSTI